MTGDLDGDPWRWQRIRHVEGTLEVGSIGGTHGAGPLHQLANTPAADPRPGHGATAIRAGVPTDRAGAR